MSQLNTHQARLLSSLHPLSLSSTRLDILRDCEEGPSPMTAPTKAGFLAFTGGGRVAPDAMRSMENLGPVSLPPPPRHLPRKKQHGPEESKRGVRQSVMSLDESVVDQSPTMAWLQREGLSGGSIFAPAELVTVVQEEEAATAEPENDRVAAVAAKAALEEATATGSSDSKLSLNANRKRESVRPESSFEVIRVAEKQYFKTSKPRIIGLFVPPPSPHTEQEKPTGDARLVDDRDSLPPTPVASEGPPGDVGSPTAACATIRAEEQMWSPSHQRRFSTATLPLKIGKKPRRQGAPSPEAPPTKTFIVPKGTAPSAPILKPRTRARLVKSKSTPGMRSSTTLTSGRAVETQQTRSFMVGRDRTGRGYPIAADHPWRRRPLISHAKSPSRSSGCSIDSDSTYNPPSTIDPREQPRISISSTIYPSSSQSVPNTADQPNFPPDNDTSDDDDHDGEPCLRNDILQEIQAEQIIDSDNYQLMSILSGTNILHSHSGPAKPPVPRTPKPIFTRKPFSEFPSPSQSPSTSLVFEGYQSSDCEPPPPTTNWLGHEERADLIRKSRKLARVFGRTPGPEVMAFQEGSRSISQAKYRHHRTPLSPSNDGGGVRHRRASAWPSPSESPFYVQSENRRHSLPLSPADISFLNASSPLYDASLSQVASQARCESSAAGTASGLSFDPNGLSIDQQSAVAHHKSDTDNATRSSTSPSRTSFIDWSDEEGPYDVGNPRPSSLTQSFFENMTPEEQAEGDKRRKREKLAKLHRFLGSTVPVNLVVGPDADIKMTSQPLIPATAPSTSTASGGRTGSDLEEASRKAWIRRRRRSSSAAAIPSSWSDDVDRMKEELDTHEKLLNVRRAQKMEKVFGVAPPQTLYHTRGHTSSPSLPSLAPIASKTLGNPSAFIPTADAMYFTRNPNRSSYEKASGKLSRRRTNGRPSTAESAKQLIPKGRRTSTTSFNFGTVLSSSPLTNGYGYGDPKGNSFNRRSTQRRPASAISFNQDQPLIGPSTNIIYNHYQHSLNSLSDIIDRDDCESLVELHHYLNNDIYHPDTKDALFISSEHDELLTPARTLERRLSDAASVLTERRRSLPIKSTSATSLVSQHAVADGLATPKPELSDFQMRRRRAAKLTQFFGVQYRELINDVLDSLENGLEHEEIRGTLQAEEIVDLLERLRELKVKREGIPT